MGTANVLRSHIVVLAASFILAGCATLHDCKYETTQRIRTGRAWLHYKIGWPGRYSSAFSQGWKAGYYDVLSGNDGAPPFFAPERYYEPCKILNDCDKPRNDWYAGFQCGAACAQNVPDTHYMKPWNPSVTSLPADPSQLTVPEVPVETMMDADQQSETEFPPRPSADDSDLVFIPL